jgi:hypothetical protein
VDTNTCGLTQANWEKTEQFEPVQQAPTTQGMLRHVVFTPWKWPGQPPESVRVQAPNTSQHPPWMATHELGHAVVAPRKTLGTAHAPGIETPQVPSTLQQAPMRAAHPSTAQLVPAGRKMPGAWQPFSLVLVQAPVVAQHTPVWHAALPQAVCVPLKTLVPVQPPERVSVQLDVSAAQQAPESAEHGFDRHSVPTPVKALVPVQPAAMVAEHEPVAAQQAPSSAVQSPFSHTEPTLRKMLVPVHPDSVVLVHEPLMAQQAPVGQKSPPQIESTPPNTLVPVQLLAMVIAQVPLGLQQAPVTTGAMMIWNWPRALK